MRRVGQVVGCSLLALSASVSSCSNEPEVVKSSNGSDGTESTTGGATTGGAGGSGGAVGTAGGSGGTTANGGTQAGNGGTTPTTSTSMGGGGEAGTPGFVVPEEPELVFEGTQLPGASGVTDFGFIPGTDDELLVLLHSGVVIHYERAATSGFVELGRAVLTDDIFFDEGCGLLSLAFDPEFETNRFIYLARCKEQTVSTIARFELDDIEALPATETEILSVEAEVAEEDWHRFGSMGFEPDGETMWALIGDLFLRQLAQDTQHKAGKLLRFKPSRDAAGSGYEPAAGNAFDDASAGDPSIYAYGLRSPWRGTRDRFGRFWIGDVGLVTTEEVNLVLSAGQNLGWDRAEGPCVTDCEGITQPLVHYGRLSDEPYAVDDPLTDPDIRRAIWVGEAYHSDRDRYYGLFDDAVIFGDFFAGWVRRLEVDDDGALIGDQLVGHLEDVTSWKTGPDGYMYLTTLPGVFHRAVQVTESE
ncbi:MAG TPA: PQQ-dependent sugar dehydrogenase [Polyangiaceae bacterium]|nr:PQQ-dependent sugar dehydrogenase [Polyangiaceae bacterium]